MDINRAMQICFKNNIKVYPIVKDKKHQVEYSKNGTPIKRYAKVLNTTKTLNEALTKTYIFLANNIKEKK